MSVCAGRVDGWGGGKRRGKGGGSCSNVTKTTTTTKRLGNRPKINQRNEKNDSPNTVSLVQPTESSIRSSQVFMNRL